MNIYQHFRKEEHNFIDQVIDWKNTVQNTYSYKLTDFLDPREQEITKSIVGENQDVHVELFGGAEWTERKRALIYPDYYVPSDDDFKLAVFELGYPEKFVTIEHPQMLGSLMGLGMRRAKFGDVIIQDRIVQFVVAEEVENYIQVNLQSVGKSKVSVKRINLSSIVNRKELWRENVTTASSLRLDIMIATIFSISRQRAQQLIKNGLVRMNWKTIEQTSFECKEGDIISVRGVGRGKLLSIEGKTKKEKWRIVVGIQK
ncbi:RNA-binding protein [Cytobacillus sp. IB215665]|uniref:YlmH family RNA-binding protein n=1 Tax=Cytobacillus sp. IB215665 TaxID=3097357 RepID=UPI002A0B6D32|nr:RNA-binding protein [Cytobacillus sp. IB215665]MDX8364988.1 RNA-binding protein [Cytobacillus sp. IB215665]